MRGSKLPGRRLETKKGSDRDTGVRGGGRGPNVSGIRGGGIRPNSVDTQYSRTLEERHGEKIVGTWI